MAEVIERNDPVVVRRSRGGLWLILLLLLVAIVAAIAFSRHHPITVNGTKNVNVPVPNVNAQ